MIWRLFRRLLGIDEVERRIENIHDQRFQLEKIIDELLDQIKKVQEEASTRQRIMRDELMESEARLMTRIEELEAVEPVASTDTLVDENRTGYIPWSERKRMAVASQSSPTKIQERLRGDIQGTNQPAQYDVRRGNNVSGDGKAPAHEGN